jgi:hypothetical protein
MLLFFCFCKFDLSRHSRRFPSARLQHAFRLLTAANEDIVLYLYLPNSHFLMRRATIELYDVGHISNTVM